MVSENQTVTNTSVPSDDMTLLREAAASHKAGDKEKARALLVEAATANPQNELVWLWQASLARTAAEAMTAIEKVLDLNPNNEKALGWKIKLEARFPAPVTPRNYVESNGAVAVAEPVKETAEQAVEEETAAEETVASEIVEEKAEEVAEESEDERATVESSIVAAEEETETAWEAQASVESAEDDDALASIEAEIESSAEAEQKTSVADFWSESETEEESGEVSEEDSYPATTRALEALDQHVANAQPHADEDDDPIRRLLAERDETARESDSDSSDSWESRYSTEEDQEDSSVDATLLAMFSQDRSGQAAVPSKEEEAEEEAEPAVQEPRKANTHWECPLCGQQSHRVEPACPTCKSVVDLNRLADMARNEDVDRVSLKRLISDWEDQADAEPTAALCTKLALGYLNLRQSNSALPHLLQAARMDRGNEALAAALEQVSRRPLVLVVDDSRTVQRMVLSTLEKELFRVQIAEDGLQALAKLNEETPSLILLDITMPRMDGYQVCKVITGNDAFKHIPVVMLSGKDGFFDKVRGRMVGAKDYITKPFEADALVKSVRKRIETPSK